MNYLELCQALAREARGAGTGPSAVTGQVGLHNRIVHWIKDAYVELQNKHVAPSWKWLMSTWSVNTVAGDDTYAGTDCTDTRLSATITRFRRWIPLTDAGYSNVKFYLQSAGVGEESYLLYLPWDYFRDRYKRGTQNNNRPAHFTTDPQNNLVIGPKPDAVYVLSGEYRMAALQLAANSDEPEIPEDFHMLIVYEAMMKYAASAVAPEVLARANVEGGRLLRQLEADQLPDMELAGPLA